jgi:phosphohistidine swiveling domain-containing protein
MNLLPKIREKDWQPWLERHNGTLVTCFIAGGLSKKIYRQLGRKPVIETCLYQDEAWFENRAIMDRAVNNLDRQYNIFKISRHFDLFIGSSEKKIKGLIKSRMAPPEKFKKLTEILYQLGNFIWITHVIEQYYRRRLDRELPLNIASDREKFIADASYPKKLSSVNKMEKAILARRPLADVAEEFGWLKMRGILGQPFSVRELAKLKVNKTKHQYPRIPQKYQPLFNEMRELVYFRTARTDALYRFLLLSRPIFKEIAAYYQIPFASIVDYSPDDLIFGKLQDHKQANIYFDKGKFYFTKKRLINVDNISGSQVKGTIAQPGRVSGKAKIVLTTAGVNKIKKGDILIAPMTFPQFIMAMKKAAAFVTDEGGLTCHAAIVAREMKKPCIIGTRIATKIFKDGDLVEVDADKGLVKILSRKK